MDSLKEKLLDQIKKRQGKVMTHREVVLFCMDNSYKPDNGTRRLREVRDKAHVDFDPTIQVITQGNTIMGYYYSPNSVETSRELVHPLEQTLYQTFKKATDTCNGDYKCFHYRTFKYCKCEVKQEIKNTLW